MVPLTAASKALLQDLQASRKFQRLLCEIEEKWFPQGLPRWNSEDGVDGYSAYIQESGRQEGYEKVISKLKGKSL